MHRAGTVHSLCHALIIRQLDVVVRPELPERRPTETLRPPTAADSGAAIAESYSKSSPDMIPMRRMPTVPVTRGAPKRLGFFFPFS
jgi:hypothetical protein